MSASKVKDGHLSKGASGRLRLYPKQRAVVERYASQVYSSDRFGIFNEHFAEFRDLVLSLPTCQELAEADVTSIAVDGLLALYQVQRDERERTGKYADVTAELTDHYVSFLQSLPRTYSLRITLPKIGGLGAMSVRLSDDVEIRTAEGADDAAPKINALAQLLIPKPSVDRARSILEVTVSGFAMPSLETQGTADALALAKQAAFLLVSNGIMQTTSWGAEKSTASLVDQTKDSEESLALPDGIAHLFGRLEVAESALEVLDPKRGLLAEWRKAETEEERQTAFRLKAAPVERFFARRRAPGQQRVAAGIEWYQDSVSGQDETMSFLAACIGIEALLGEEEGGITELSRRLVDRYAFMLGKDRENRSRLAKEFEAVLKVRGELVHARSTRLRARDRDRLKDVQQILSNLLQHELRPFTALESG